MQQTLGQFQRMPGVGSRTLLQAQRQSRRSLLKGFVLLAGGSALGYGGWRYQRPEMLQSPRGERLSVTLADGSHLLLNSDSAVEVAYDQGQRRLILHRGEILVTTAHDPQSRGFFVQVGQGRIQALGTRFSVRLHDQAAEVAVFEHQVRLTPLHGPALLLDAGQQSTLTPQAATQPVPTTPGQDAWSNGLLVANRQRLDAFIAELGRYRQGWLRCDPAIAGLRISGTFSIDDTDSALRALEASLPVKRLERTRYWVTLVPR